VALLAFILHLVETGAFLSFAHPGLPRTLDQSTFSLPVLIWNFGMMDHAHSPQRPRRAQPSCISPFVISGILGSELILLNPVYFLGILWAAIAVWRYHRDHPLLLYFFCMGAPLFLFYWMYTLRARVQPNWIAPSVVPLSCLMVIYWQARWRTNAQRLKPVALPGLWFGLIAVVVLHDTNLVEKMAGRPLPPKIDPCGGVRGQGIGPNCWGGKEQTVIRGQTSVHHWRHYGISGLVSFYVPEASRPAG
jgi:hypothetical protein